MLTVGSRRHRGWTRTVETPSQRAAEAPGNGAQGHSAHMQATLVWRKPFSLGGAHQSLQGSEDTELRNKDQSSAFPLCPWSLLCGGSRAPPEGRYPPAPPRAGLELLPGPHASSWEAQGLSSLPWRDSAGAFWRETPAGHYAISSNTPLSSSLPFLRLRFPMWMMGRLD